MCGGGGSGCVGVGWREWMCRVEGVDVCGWREWMCGGGESGCMGVEGVDVWGWRGGGGGSGCMGV